MRSRPLLTGEWRHLLMVNYAIDPSLLEPLMPRGTMLDTFDGKAYASVVAFLFLRTRILGVAVPLHRDFPELNLRFYVRREVAGETRHGVVFVSEAIPRRAIVLAARTMYNEPYVALPMRSSVEGDPPVVTYAWRVAGRWHRLGARAQGAGVIPAPGSFEHFIAMRFWSYTRQPDGSTYEYEVEHPHWIIWPADALRIEADFSRLYGPELGAALVTHSSVFIAAGSPAALYRPQRLPPSKAAA